MEAAEFQRWLDRYFEAWRSNDPEQVASLFADDARYFVNPYRPPREGREAIVQAWVDGGVQRELRIEYEPLAVSGERGLAHWAVSFAEDGSRREFDGILQLDFDAEGRCLVHREWYATRLADERDGS